MFENLKNLIPEEKLVKFGDIDIKVKQFLSIEQKKELIKIVTDVSFIEDENKNIFADDIYEDIITVSCILNFYTDLDLPKITSIDNGKEFSSIDIVKVYDIALGSGLYDFICENMNNKEKEFIKNKIANSIWVKEEKLEKENSITNIIKSFLDKIIKTLPDKKELGKLLKSASKELKNFDINKLQVLNDMKKFVEEKHK